MAHKIDWLVDFFLFDLFLVFHVIIGFLNLILVRFELQFPRRGAEPLRYLSNPNWVF